MDLLKLRYMRLIFAGKVIFAIWIKSCQDNIIFCILSFHLSPIWRKLSENWPIYKVLKKNSQIPKSSYVVIACTAFELDHLSEHGIFCPSPNFFLNLCFIGLGHHSAKKLIHLPAISNSKKGKNNYYTIS